MARILYVTSYPPLPTTIGGHQRANLLHRALSSLGQVEMILNCNPAAITPEVLEQLRTKFGLLEAIAPVERGRYFPWNLVRPFMPGVVDRLAHNLGKRDVDYSPEAGMTGAAMRALRGNKYDLIVGRYIKPAAKARLFGKTPLALDVDDLDTEMYRSRLAVPSVTGFERMMLQRHLSQLERLLPPLLKQANVLWVSNANDRALPGMERAEVLRNIPYTSDGLPLSYLPPQEGSRRILIVGTMSHGPNRDGVEFFLRNCWPKIIADVPEAECELVGAGMSAEQQARWRAIKGVVVTGLVESVEGAYKRCALTVAPIFTGAGTNIKVVESLGFGRAAVITAHAHRGLEDVLFPGAGVEVAAPEELAAKCVALLRDPVRAAQMGRQGNALINRHFSYAAFRDVVQRSVEPLLAAGAANRRD